MVVLKNVDFQPLTSEKRIFQVHGGSSNSNFLSIFLWKLFQETFKMRIFWEHGVWKNGDLLAFFHQKNIPRYF